MFGIGDRIVHPMHGAGVIDDIVREKIGCNWQEYYVFRMPFGDLLLKIPVTNAQTIGVRPVVSAAAVQEVLRKIPEMDTGMTANWNRRYRENMEHLKSGDLYQVARVIKALMQRESQRGLSTGERKLLHSAKQIFISEVALAEDLAYDGAEERVKAAMRSEMEKACI